MCQNQAPKLVFIQERNWIWPEIEKICIMPLLFWVTRSHEAPFYRVQALWVTLDIGGKPKILLTPCFTLSGQRLGAKTWSPRVEGPATLTLFMPFLCLHLHHQTPHRVSSSVQVCPKSGLVHRAQGLQGVARWPQNARATYHYSSTHLHYTAAHVSGSLWHCFKHNQCVCNYICMMSLSGSDVK